MVRKYYRLGTFSRSGEPSTANSLQMGHQLEDGNEGNPGSSGDDIGTHPDAPPVSGSSGPHRWGYKNLLLHHPVLAHLSPLRAVYLPPASPASALALAGVFFNPLVVA